MSDDSAAVLITRLFTEALEARDLDALRVPVADNVEFQTARAVRSPAGKA